MVHIEWQMAEPGIALLTINRPDRRNALSGNTLAAMHIAIDDIGGRADVRVVIINGAGKGFCAGADMRATADDMNDLGSTPIGALTAAATNTITRSFGMQELMTNLFEKIHRLRQPVIAAVHGGAHGGGFALAMACDIRVASKSASFGAVFIKRGVSARDMGTSYHLQRLVGRLARPNCC